LPVILLLIRQNLKYAVASARNIIWLRGVSRKELHVIPLAKKD
jgi:hypothetical protein